MRYRDQFEQNGERIEHLDNKVRKLETAIRELEEKVEALKAAPTVTLESEPIGTAAPAKKTAGTRAKKTTGK